MRIFNPSTNQCLRYVVTASQKWQFRYFIRPLCISLPPGLVASFYGTDLLHSKIRENYPSVTSFCDRYVFWAYVLGFGSVFLISVIFGWIESLASDKENIDDIAQHSLLKVFERIVGAKAERFEKTFKEINRSGQADASKVFVRITQPGEQIALLTEGLCTFFQAIDKDSVTIRVGTAPIVNGTIGDEWICFSPATHPPRTSLKDLRRSDSAISACLRKKQIYIVEDIEKEARKKSPGYVFTGDSSDREEGSLICYPVFYPGTSNIIYVLSIVANKKGYFTKKKQVIYDHYAKQFALRIRLEHTLLLLKQQSVPEGA